MPIVCIGLSRIGQSNVPRCSYLIGLFKPFASVRPGAYVCRYTICSKSYAKRHGVAAFSSPKLSTGHCGSAVPEALNQDPQKRPLIKGLEYGRRVLLKGHDCRALSYEVPAYEKL